MKRGLDSNVLIAAHLPAHPAHERVRRFLLACARSTDDTLVVTPLVLHELVHIITDGKRFDPPVSMSEAIAIAGLYLRRSNVECLDVGEAAVAHAFELIGRHHLGRNRIADTLLAATLITAGVPEIVTCNPRDFGVFEGLRVTDPTAE